MAFENLSEKISAAFKRLRSKGKLTESDVKTSMREIRLALLEADVNYKVAKEFTNKVTERAIGSQVMESLTPAQMVIKIVNEELIELMGVGKNQISFSSKPPTVILLCGLQGSGKTTHAAKLALKFKKQGHMPLLVACDVYRPAAIKQLQILAEQINVNVFEMGNISPLEISKNAISFAKDHGNDIVIIDTAGRLHVDEGLMNELKELKENLNPQEILLVVDAMTGQDAVTVAKSFNDLLDITGVILTKLDGDARGGAALSVKSVIGKPIKFIGVGEKLENLEEFHPDRMASRILGMGDVLTLIENAAEKFDQKEVERLSSKIQKNSFDLNDLKDQMLQIKKMGSLKSILTKLPGMDRHLKNVDIDDKIMDRTCSIILSMTPKERSKPEIINPSRKRRIASGSGVKVEEVNKLLKQFEQMRNVMKKFRGGFGGKIKRGIAGFRFPKFF